MNAKVIKGTQCQERTGNLPHATEVLVRKFVAQMTRTAPVSTKRVASTEARREVLFSCEVDGVRCTLVQAHQGQADTVALSPREQEIARMIAKGYPNKTIAGVLDISVWTVSTHLRRIFAKLGVSSRAAMVGRMIDPRNLR